MTYFMRILASQSMSTEAMNGSKGPETKRLTIVLPVHLHELGKQLARADHRDFSGQVAALIEAEAKRNPPPQPERVNGEEVAA